MTQYRFRASDASLYVDSYRRHILRTPAALSAEINRAEEHIFQAKNPHSRLYAELRAAQHALNLVVKREEPGIVILGPDGDYEEVDYAARAEELTKQLEEKADELTRLEGSLTHVRSKERDLAGEVMARNQQVDLLKHRLSQSQSSLAIVSAACVALVVGLLIVLILD